MLFCLIQTHNYFCEAMLRKRTLASFAELSHFAKTRNISILMRCFYSETVTEKEQPDWRKYRLPLEM